MVISERGNWVIRGEFIRNESSRIESKKKIWTFLSWVESISNLNDSDSPGSNTDALKQNSQIRLNPRKGLLLIVTWALVCTIKKACTNHFICQKPIQWAVAERKSHEHETSESKSVPEILMPFTDSLWLDTEFFSHCSIFTSFWCCYMHNSAFPFLSFPFLTLFFLAKLTASGFM